jgi:hypothetical protein
MTKFAVAILLLALMMPASAEDMNSANYILPGCKPLAPGSTATWKHGLCAGFVAGVAFARKPIVCVPEEVTTGQVMAVVVKYIEARPERMHEGFGSLALEALTAAWPCKR